MNRHTQTMAGMASFMRRRRKLPIGSGLAIGCTLGIVGWWAILHTVFWIAR